MLTHGGFVRLRFVMTRRRIRVAAGEGYYHCISRVVAGESLLGEMEREVFARALNRAAEFCGLRILTYAIMSNHFHVLVAVPDGSVRPDDSELVRRYAVLYGAEHSPFRPSPVQLAEILRGGGRDAERIRRRLLARMHDVTPFMQLLKQRFALWYNRTHARFGAFWAERFKSLLVEPSLRALSTVAAYIDLNPVRAGLVRDPADYRWCGYAAAMGGVSAAVQGVAEIVRGTGTDRSTGLAVYRRILFDRGERSVDGKASLDREHVLSVLRDGGKVSLPELLRCRIRYFSEGRVLGSRSFVESIAQEATAGRRERRRRFDMKGTEWADLTVGSEVRGALFT